MLYFPKGRQFIGSELPIASGQSVVAEGCALIGTGSAGVWGVQPSSATTTETFIGASVAQQLSLLFQTIVEDIIQPSTALITLKRIPSSSATVGVYDVTANAAIPTGGGGWTLSGQQLTFQSSTNGHELLITYRYAITAIEARALQGDIVPGGAAGNLVNQVGVIRNGVIYTTEFDTSQNWFATNPTIKTVAGGLFSTSAGTGSTPSPLIAIIGLPSTLYPYLGLMLTA